MKVREVDDSMPTSRIINGNYWDPIIEGAKISKGV